MCFGHLWQIGRWQLAGAGDSCSSAWHTDIQCRQTDWLMCPWAGIDTSDDNSRQAKNLLFQCFIPGLHIVWTICFLECYVERFEGDVAKGKSGIAFPWNAVQSEVSIFICKGKRTVASLYPYENMLDGCWICRVQYDSFDDLSHSRCDGEEKQTDDMCCDFSHSLLFDVCKVYIFIL